MITNKKKFLKVVKKDFPTYIDDNAIIREAEEKLCINNQVEFTSFVRIGIYIEQIIKLYDFITLKNGKKRFIGV